MTTTTQAPQSPGAPKTARGARTRARILKAAEETFGSLGYHRAGVTDITRTAGVAQGTFYTYFASKEEILRELVMDLGHKLRAHLAAEILGSSDRLEAEERGLRAFLQYLADHPSLYRVLQEAQFVDETIYREYYETFARGYADMLDAASRKGEIRPGNNHHRAWALMGLSHFLGLKYALWDQRAKEGEGAFDPIVETMADLFQNGLALNGRDKG
ncbi:transcriptional regulator, TetR family [Marinobacter daqiaonensis]|uniref:Transcriptional regulator, TetR family n=1 Tax=Marinobacter daqiaonensis TaxID=650891 RepID=A0A1I6INX3_9GAMM|nr:TetR/AcrR family transcriptional regulator [Marinobacter daqiaonensis]SFR68445.1 transcriptional regulator, TetR family [Marinobacter daqiaonensis]